MQAYAINSSFFLHFVTKIGVFATSSLVCMALNLICYVLHRSLLFPPRHHLSHPAWSLLNRTLRTAMILLNLSLIS